MYANVPATIAFVTGNAPSVHSASDLKVAALDLFMNARATTEARLC